MLSNVKKMKNYSNYKVEKISNFLDFFIRLKEFSNKKAFVLENNVISYEELLSNIRKVSRLFTDTNRFVLINVADKYLFTVAYFATILSGNIACLQPYSEKVIACFSKFPFLTTINDDVVKAILLSEDCDLNYAENNGIATVFCSSGTTSSPKAVALTQKNIINDMIAGMEKYEIAKHGRYVSILPYAHAYGLTCDLLAPLYSASTIYPAYDVMSFFGALITFHPTALNVTPKIVQALAERIKNIGNKELVVGKALKKILSGGAETKAELCTFMRSYDIGVYGCYGLSECSPCVCVNRDDYYKDGSAGVMLDCNTVSIEPTGQIKIIGSNVMAGYLDEYGNIVEPTNGIYISNDLGYLDEDGFLFVQGRVDDLMIFSDGHKLLPQVVESEILSITGIIEAIVYMKHDKLHAVAVISDLSLVNIIEHKIKSKTYNGYKLSSVVLTTEPLIKTALGKINRSYYGKE